MVVLITGSSHTGKTLLAQALLNKYQYPYLSIDLLKMGLIRSGNTNLTPADDQDLEAYLWPIVREIIKTAIENQQNLSFTLIRKYSQQLINNADKQSAGNKQAFSFSECMPVYFLSD